MAAGLILYFVKEPEGLCYSMALGGLPDLGFRILGSSWDLAATNISADNVEPDLEPPWYYLPDKGYLIL